MPRPLLITLLACVALAGVCAAVDWWWAYPLDTPMNFVGRNSCASCHAEQTQHWTGSDHDLAMDLATPSTVLGNFANQPFTHFGVTSTMTREGDAFYITTDNAQGELEKFPIKYVFGVRPLQQYMVEFADGRVQVLSIAWDTLGKRWFHLYPNEKIPHTDELHWTRPAQNWNFMCADCHSTNLQKHYDLASNTFHTTWSEIDVSCEACHGPGSLHIDLVKSRSLFWDRNHGHGLAPLKSASSKHEVETCAKCHARRRIVHANYHPGREFLDYYEPTLLDGREYHADGQILEEDYEYGSFLQSRMHRENVRCSDCHDPHSTKLKLPGNQLCVRCHTLAKGNYDSPAHHRHAQGTQAAQCVECHMPVKHYMVVDPRRDHSLRVPRPDLSVKLGTPNACQACHAKDAKQLAKKDDQPLIYTDEQLSQKIVEWYPNKRHRQPHYGEAIAAGRDLRPEGEVLLRRIVQGGQESDRAKAVGGYVRASALSLLGNYSTDAARDLVIAMLGDQEPQVRIAAVRSMELPREFSEGQAAKLRDRLVPLLDDPVRGVRTEAARILARVPLALLDQQQLAKFNVVLAEWEAGQRESDDRADAHMAIGIVRENLGRTDDAISEYRTALRLDELSIPARVNLAMLEHQRQNSTEAERLYREVIKLRPDWDAAHYSLGLLLAESRVHDAIEPLREATRLSPRNARMQYNLALALQQSGQLIEAEGVLRRACELDIGMVDPRLALTLLYAEQKRWVEAFESAQRLVALDPSQQRLLQQIGAQLQRSKSAGPVPP